MARISAKESVETQLEDLAGEIWDNKKKLNSKTSLLQASTARFNRAIEDTDWQAAASFNRDIVSTSSELAEILATQKQLETLQGKLDRLLVKMTEEERAC